MAKKKMMQQLDLFSMFAEPEPVVEKEPVKEEKIAPKTSAVAEEKTILEPEQAKPINESPVVFSDGKISVKIKAQPVAAKEEAKAVIERKITKPSVQKEATTSTNPLKKRGRKSFKDMDAEVDLINVPDEETLNKKLYYSIGEVAKFFNVNSSLIRAWEIEFDILQPRKNRKGDRYFRVEDIKNLQMIYYLLRNRKFSIDGAKKYIKSNKKGADTNYQLTQSLKKFRSFLLELKGNLAVL